MGRENKTALRRVNLNVIPNFSKWPNQLDLAGSPHRGISRVARQQVKATALAPPRSRLLDKAILASDSARNRGSQVMHLCN